MKSKPNMCFTNVQMFSEIIFLQFQHILENREKGSVSSHSHTHHPQELLGQPS